MNKAVLALYLINFAFIGALPFTFFKKGGSLTAMWWLTASPFLLCVTVLLASFFEVAPAVTGHGFFESEAVEVASVLFAVGSIALIALTLGTHRIPISLWQQNDDAPQHIVTYGAYRYIRHPFYAAFLLTLAGAFLFSPQPGTLLALVFAATVLTVTAAREERRLCASAFGEEYAAYMQRTGRFTPKLWSKPHDA